MEIYPRVRQLLTLEEFLERTVSKRAEIVAKMDAEIAQAESDLVVVRGALDQYDPTGVSEFFLDHSRLDGKIVRVRKSEGQWRSSPVMGGG